MCNCNLLNSSNINDVKINKPTRNVSKPTYNVTEKLQFCNKSEIFKNCIEKL